MSKSGLGMKLGNLVSTCVFGGGGGGLEKIKKVPSLGGYGYIQYIRENFICTRKSSKRYISAACAYCIPPQPFIPLIC